MFKLEWKSKGRGQRESTGKVPVAVESTAHERTWTEPEGEGGGRGHQQGRGRQHSVVVAERSAVVRSCLRACLVASVVLNSLWPHGLWLTRLLGPWDSPGKSPGVGYHALLQGILPTQGSNPRLLQWYMHQEAVHAEILLTQSSWQSFELGLIVAPFYKGENWGLVTWNQLTLDTYLARR